MRTLLLLLLMMATAFGQAVAVYPSLIVGEVTYRNAQLSYMKGELVVIKHATGVARLQREEIPPLMLADLDRVWAGMQDKAKAEAEAKADAGRKASEIIESQKNAVKFIQMQFQVLGPYKDERFGKVKIGGYAAECLLRKVPDSLQKGDIFVAECKDLGSMQVGERRYLVYQIERVIKKESK